MISNDWFINMGSETNDWFLTTGNKINHNIHLTHQLITIKQLNITTASVSAGED